MANLPGWVVEHLIAVRGDALDETYLRSQIVAMLGADDPRVTTWDRLLTEHRSA
jgi:hypothetical protein